MPCSPALIKENQMAINILSNISTPSHIECVKYVPLTVVYDSNTDVSRHIMFTHEDTDCLEFVLDWETGRIKKIILVICNHATYSTEQMAVPMAAEGALSVDLPKVTTCDKFKVVVFRDGIDIGLYPAPVARRIRCGNVIFGLSEEGCLSSLSVIDMKPKELRHMILELEADREANPF